MRTILLIHFLIFLIQSKIFSQSNDTDTLILILKDSTEYTEQLNHAFDQADVKNLRIVMEANQWVVFPTGFSDNFNKASYSFISKLNILPEDIGEMAALEVLSISYLGLDFLPESLPQLKNLRELDISFNNLNLENEFDKILQLMKLEVLKIYGYGLGESALSNIKKVMPQLKIFYTKEQYLKDLNK